MKRYSILGILVAILVSGAFSLGCKKGTETATTLTPPPAPGQEAPVPPSPAAPSEAPAAPEAAPTGQPGQ